MVKIERLAVSYSVLRDASPHAFGMNLPALGETFADELRLRHARRGSERLRLALLQYEMKHYPEAPLQKSINCV